MKILTTEFLMSNTDFKLCPPPDKPEYAFIGRSNVGKSSLINMIANNNKLAKISGSPGKTQCINHFLMNKDWYLVDLPGYGYAKTSKKIRETFSKMIKDYLLFRENLVCVFILIDSRHSMQKNDLDFINWMGENSVPFSIVFTKADKLGVNVLKNNIEKYKSDLLNYWETLPENFVSSSESGLGREEILDYINSLNQKVNFE